MPTVETARGPVDTAALGFTLSHEHVISGDLGVRSNWPHLFDREAEIARTSAPAGSESQSAMSSATPW